MRLLKAVEIGQIATARVFIAEGDDVNEFSESGNCPLLEAANCNGTQMVALLLKHDAAPDVHDMRKNTPLSWAIKHKNAEMENLINTALENQTQSTLRM
ncbi:ankyrin repeat protein [Legionella massiliensis]|uniref:Ankyrin repeat protein n=1 Tax=Legionella massiliensis TaxID=1034943 RepID=A0A078KYJ5_9GAMM|nr:ankyrin repeat domain-containing protein [Legionella massiliensis]CDZ78147.1 ankyrin repeat protein [Legionella massiliensis]CEE13885.1 Ankyrin repeats (3 copies) [Legionella massiliensis]